MEEQIYKKTQKSPIHDDNDNDDANDSNLPIYK